MKARLKPSEPKILEVQRDLVEIEEKTFWKCQAHTVVIPKTVRVIKHWAFAGMWNLKTLRFEPQSALERVESAAFAGTGLGKVDFPPGATIEKDWNEVTDDVRRQLLDSWDRYSPWK